MKMKKMSTVASFLANVPADKRPALERLRMTIRAAAPDTIEEISYSIPAFKYQGHPLVSYGYGKEHCSFYLQSPAVMKAHAKQLKGYDTSKGTVRFTPAKPIAAALVKKLVKARIAENRKRFG